MSEYSYLAVDPRGRRVKGNIEAADSRAAVRQLQDKNLTVIRTAEANLLNKEINIRPAGRARARDIGIFCRQMFSMLDAGVPVTKALDMLSEQTGRKALKNAVTLMRDSVARGETLSESMRQSDKVFPQMLINLVETGEESGSLNQTFQRMAIHYEKQAKLSGMMKKAMIYPAVILVVAVAVVIIMSIVVIPQFAEMFDSLGAELPLITRIVMAISSFIIHFWYVLIALIIIAAAAWRYFLGTDRGKHVWGRIKLKVPVFGMLGAKSASASFARTMSTMLYSGMPITRAIEATAASLTNVLFRDVLTQIRADVEQGRPMSDTLRSSKVFPPLVGYMTAVGEETGELDVMLEKVADYFEEEVELTTASLASIIEPLVIVILGVVVGFIVLALYMPMISLYQGLESL